MCRADFNRKKRFTLILALHTIGGASVGIVRIVVVQCAGRVHVANVVRVGSVGRTQPQKPQSFNL